MAIHCASNQHKSELISIVKSNGLKLTSQNVRGELCLSGFNCLLHNKTLCSLDPQIG